MTVVRAFGREKQSYEKTKAFINAACHTDAIREAAGEYNDERIKWLSNSLKIVVGVICINLKGAYAPIYLAMMYRDLEHVTHDIRGVMHSFRENENNLKSLQKLLKLENIK